MALLNHRHFVTPDDIKTVAKAVLSHRLIAQERSGELAHQIIDSVLQSVPIPLNLPQTDKPLPGAEKKVSTIRPLPKDSQYLKR
jgi:hypothetical protein